MHYRDPDRHSREKSGFVRKRDAEDFLANITITTNRGEFVDPRTARLIIAEAGSDWIANQRHLKASAFRSIESSWRVHVLPFWGRRRLGEVRHSDVQTWVTQLSAGDGVPRSATVVLRAYGILAGILDVAVLDRRISSNPARSIKLPRKAKKKHVYLTVPQVELLATCAGEHATLVYTLAYTGLRWGEAIGLRVRSLDTSRRRMLVDENAVTIGSSIIVGTPKTHENRSVPFPKFLTEPLHVCCREKTKDQLLFGSGATHLRRAGSKQGWFWNANCKAQLVDPDFPYLTPHNLRHTAASIAISAGANVKAVQRMLGHASAAMTLDTYADLFEDDLDDVSDRMDALRAEAMGTGASETASPQMQAC